MTPDLVALADMSPAAQWLTTTFQSFDYKILEFYHNLHEACGRPLDLFMDIFTRLGDDGIFLIFVALFLMLFKKTRKFGAGMLGGVIIGAVLTNLTIKNVVARPRPYAAFSTYKTWWESVAHGLESEYSFPSGHTTACTAATTPLFLFLDKKKSWLVFLFPLAIGATRNYLMVHYPSDILGGLIVGCIAGILSYLIMQALYDRICQKGKLGNYIGEFDVRNLFKKKA